jgi:hypothetical protein
MKRFQEQPYRIVRIPAYHRAFQRLEAGLARALERHQRESSPSESERIDRARLALFGVLAE